MTSLDRHAHWQNVYQTKGERDVSWYQQTPEISLDLIRAAGATADAAIIDIGGGASRLVDALVNEGFRAVSVLDVSEAALEASKARLGPSGANVKWIVSDVTTWTPQATYDVWHDRAAFHFLTDPTDRVIYAAQVLRAMRPGGHVIIGTFALDGPERCSGLPVVRHDSASLAHVLGPHFGLVESRSHAHQTPMGTTQRFQFSRFRRSA